MAGAVATGTEPQAVGASRGGQTVFASSSSSQSKANTPLLSN